MAENKENSAADDDVIPEDFFDDFSNTEFMAGLDVIDAWDEGEDAKDKRGARATRKPPQSDKQPERGLPDIHGRKRRLMESPGREPRLSRSPPDRRRPRESPDKRRRYSPPRHRGPVPRREDFRRPVVGRRSRSRSRSRSPRGRRRSPPKKTPFLEELAQKLAEKGHSLTGLQPNPYAFQAQGYPNYPPNPGYPYPVPAPGPSMVMPPYPQVPMVSYPNLPQYQPVPADFPSPQWPTTQPSTFNNTPSVNLVPRTVTPNVEPMIPGTNPEPPDAQLKTPQQEKFHLGLAQMLEDNYVEVKEKIAELSSKDSILVRCKKAIDAMKGDSKSSSAFIFVPMTMPKDMVDGSPVGKSHHVKFPCSAGNCEIDTHFITLSSARTREVAQKLGLSAARIINKMKVQDVTDKMSTNNNTQNTTDMSLGPDNYCTTAVQTEHFECPKCLQKELLTHWDSAAQTDPMPATPTVQDMLPDYDEPTINILRRFGQQQRDILIFFMRLIERPEYVTPYHVNTLTSRLQDLPKSIFNQMRQMPQNSYIVAPTPDFRRF